jgi:hypothetical protein
LIDEWIKKNITCSLSYAKSRPKNQNINWKENDMSLKQGCSLEVGTSCRRRGKGEDEGDYI